MIGGLLISGRVVLIYRRNKRNQGGVKMLEKKPEEQEGRIEIHGKDAGVVTVEMLEKRAGELALIDGRSEDEVTEEDRNMAKKELMDEEFALSSQDMESNVVATRATGDIAVDTGHEVKESRQNDEQSLAEEEAREGVREAEHDRMLRSRREGEEDRENIQ